jgi:hypothetical protein
MATSPYFRCSRCGGNMVYENFYSGAERFLGLKCVICGEIIDPVILHHRQMKKLGQAMILPKRGIPASEFIHA